MFDCIISPGAVLPGLHGDEEHSEHLPLSGSRPHLDDEDVHHHP